MAIACECLAHLSSAAEIQSLLPTDDLAIYRKADLVANCYNRNLPIRANINLDHETGHVRDAAEIASNLLGSHESTADRPRVHDRRLP